MVARKKSLKENKKYVYFLDFSDVALCANKNCGLTHCVYSSVCKSSYSSQEIEDVEEGSARYRFLNS